MNRSLQAVKRLANVTVPGGWNRAACLAWSENKQQEAINHVLADLNAQEKKSPRLTLQLCYYLFLLGDYRAASKFLILQMQHTPEHLEVILNLSVCLSRIQEYEKAIVCAKKVLSLDVQQYVAWDVLASAYYHLGDTLKASEAGTSSLEIKNKNINSSPQGGFKLPVVSPSSFARDKKKVLSFSLWGHKPRYLRGALHNLLLAPEIYPGWICRYYVDKSVPADFLEVLQQLGAEIICLDSDSLGEKLTWRFRVANDPEVGFFGVRDADSVISLREAEAVEAWMQSGQYFHIMRDWWTHTDLVLAGMWGGVGGVLPNISKLYQAYGSKHVPTPNIDQWFLRDCVWGMMRQSCVVHDRCFKAENSRGYPSPPPDSGHIGQNEWAVREAEQADFLQQWIAQLPCLSIQS